MAEDMDTRSYMIATRKTAIYPEAEEGSIAAVLYVALGLAGEAGEVANKIKKVIRDDDWIITDERRQELMKELGDVAWYLFRTCDELGLTVGQVLQANVDKLKKRAELGVISGSGDTREDKIPPDGTPVYNDAGKLLGYFRKKMPMSPMCSDD